MKAALVIDEAGLELQLTPVSAYDRQVLRILGDAAKFKAGVAGLVTIPIARDTSNESGATIEKREP